MFHNWPSYRLTAEKTIGFRQISFHFRFFQRVGGFDIRNQLDTMANKMTGKIRNVTCVMQELGYVSLTHINVILIRNNEKDVSHTEPREYFGQWICTRKKENICGVHEITVIIIYINEILIVNFTLGFNKKFCKNYKLRKCFHKQTLSNIYFK